LPAPGWEFPPPVWDFRPKNHRFSRNKCAFGIAAFGGKVKKPLVSEHGVVFWPWYLGKTPLRDPFKF
jgi:hypothetical protein